MKSQITESLVADNEDGRPYAEVQLLGKPIRGLLDSGANVSLLGKNCEEILKDPTVHFRHLPSSIKTANGNTAQIIGHVKIPVTFAGQTNLLTLHLAPNLQQELYLGVDFWRLFNIKIVYNTSAFEFNSPSQNLVSSEIVAKTTNNNDHLLFHDLTPIQQQQLETVKQMFPSSANLGLGKTHLLKHTIDIGNAKPVKQRYYAVSPAVEAEMYKEIDRMLSLGVIEESASSWSSPMAIVRKADGRVRLCLDARKVNSVTVKDAYPLPLIDGLLGRLNKTRFISSLDLKDAFWQIPLDEGSRDKTAFTVPGRPLYHFTVMPFGLCNAPQTMCRLMHRVIPHELHTQVFVYLDDLLIAAETFDEHLALLSKVGKLLSRAGLTINLEKSKFLLKEIRYLGYIVGDGVLKVDPSKVSAITSYPIPKTVRQLRRFLGMSGWYRRFIQQYSDLATPLTNLLKKNQKLKWNDDAQKSFELLKLAVSSAPVLCNPDWSKPFWIQCDASMTGVGAVLFQKSSSGDERPIAFVSQKLNAAQRNYSVTELECYAAVLSVEKFRQYVEGYPFTIITDHASLKWLMGQRELSGRLARWSLKLQGFNFTIEYRKGKDNIVPDALSRQSEALTLNKDTDDQSFPLDPDPVHFQDPEYLNLLNLIQSNPVPNSNYRISDGRILILPKPDSYSVSDIPSWKMYVPTPLAPTLIENAHSSPTAAHLGIRKTLEVLRRYYHWPTMANDVHQYITRCETCKSNKASNSITRPPIGPCADISRTFQKLYIDFMGPYPRSKQGNTYLFVCLDHFSRFVLLEPMRDANSKNVVKFLEDRVLNVYSVPEEILSDNGKQFTSNIFREFVKKHGISHTLTPKYSPQANVSERVNRSVLSAIRSYIQSDHTTWDNHIHGIASALRNVTHESTGRSPHFLVFGRHYIPHGSHYRLLRQLHSFDDPEAQLSNADRLSIAQKTVLENLRKSHERNAHTYNLRSRSRKFFAGQEIFVRNFCQSAASQKFSAKLAPKFRKAYIKEPVGNVAYKLVDENGTNLGTYHVKDIKS